MGRTIKNRNIVTPKPVQKIELSEENSKKRGLAAVLFLIIGVALLAYCFYVFITPDSGWTRIEANRTVNESVEYVFQYYLGADGADAKAESIAVTALYNQLTEKTFRLFHDKEGFEDTVNIYEINRKPNTELEVDELLYNVFSVFKSLGSRYLYLAPVYSRYENVFYCADDSMLADFDPLSSEDVRLEYKAVCEYINDPKMIDLQLLGDNKIKLLVSDSYLEYAENEGITDFIGLSWLKNAFAVDYFTEVLTEYGYTHGSISSYDGFIRNLDGGTTDYSFNIFDKKDGNNVYQAAVMHYSGAKSIVYLRNYAMNELDLQHYYRLQNGEMRIPYLDIEDGIPKSALNNLVSYSKNKGCAEIVLEMMNVYVADDFDRSALGLMSDKDIFSVYCDGFTIMYNEKELVLTDFFDSDGVTYTAETFE